ncbi:MAG: hypothetical protein LBH10_04410 [Burkholderiaceae bacterium]|jgi:hypothetical protein|nr:hypothetical protein [Burkholderiaceae bacterium]
MKVREFEEKVWAIEGVRIVLRVDQNTEVGDYPYERAADETWRITELMEKRILKNSGEISWVVIQGDGEQPHGAVILRTIRRSYGGYNSSN